MLGTLISSSIMQSKWECLLTPCVLRGVKSGGWSRFVLFNLPLFFLPPHAMTLTVT